MLKVKNLSVSVKDKKESHYLIKDVSFSLNDGESLGIIGKSGAGKSTLAKALLQIYDNNTFCSFGNIIYNNVSFNKSLRGKVFSLIFQNPDTYLNPLMKVGKQISEMLTFHYKETRKRAKEKAIEFMRKVKLPNPEKIYNYYPYQLSGGMKQKICLCVALICKPKVLIMDESTSYLDKESEREILDLINSFREEYHFILIMISHDFKLIYSMCDKIAIMKYGQIVELGEKDEIILSSKHSYTLELLCAYLSFCEDIDCLDYFKEDDFKMDAPIVWLSETHYVRKEEKFISNAKKIKEKVYESFRN